MSNSIALIGSRAYPRPDLVRAYVRKLPTGTVLHCAGSAGPATWAAEEARAMGLEVRDFAMDPEHGRGASYRRDIAMLNATRWIVVFWDGASSGTRTKMERAGHAGKLWRVYLEDGRRMSQIENETWWCPF